MVKFWSKRLTYLLIVLSKGGIGMVTVRPIEDNKLFQSFILLEVVFKTSHGPEAVNTRIGLLGSFFNFCWDIKLIAGSHGLFKRSRRPSLAKSPPGASGVFTATILSIRTGTFDLSLCKTSIYETKYAFGRFSTKVLCSHCVTLESQFTDANKARTLFAVLSTTSRRWIGSLAIPACPSLANLLQNWANQ